MIEEEQIMKQLNWLLSHSEPGATVNFLTVVAAPADAYGPFGLPEPDKLNTSVYAIAIDDSVDPGGFTAKVVVMAGVQAVKNSETPLFAALSQEVWSVTVKDELARKLQAEGKLEQHPSAGEKTVVYAACRDGRRWRGMRWLTGTKAGQTEEVELLVGRPVRDEGYLADNLVRKLVGL